MNDWWKGRALDQSIHERINAKHYPGTRQICTTCDGPTGQCEEDGYFDERGEPHCRGCYASLYPKEFA